MDTKLRTANRHRSPERTPLGGRSATVVELRPARAGTPKRNRGPIREPGSGRERGSARKGANRGGTVPPGVPRTGVHAGAGHTTHTAPAPTLLKPKVSRQAASKVDIGQALRRRSVPRAPFVLLVLALLGGSLICLLVINTTLGATSFRISQLQSTNANLTQQEHTLRQQIAGQESPGQIAKAAERLGMRQPSQLTFMNPRSHQIYRQDAGHPQKVTRAGSTR